MKRSSYLISIAIVLAALLGAIWVGGNHVLWFVDVASLAVLILFCVPLLVSTFGWKGYWSAYRLAFRKEPASKADYAEAKAVLDTTIRLLYLAAVIAAFIGYIAIMARMNDDPDLRYRTANYAIAIIALFYALVIHMVILEPVRGYLKKAAAGEDVK